MPSALTGYSFSQSAAYETVFGFVLELFNVRLAFFTVALLFCRALQCLGARNYKPPNLKERSKWYVSIVYIFGSENTPGDRNSYLEVLLSRRQCSSPITPRMIYGGASNGRHVDRTGPGPLPW